jgi:hypothetical protein
MISKKNIGVFYLHYSWKIIESGVNHNNPNSILDLQ